MTAGRRPRVFTIPTGVPFAETLADGLLQEAGGDTLALSRMTVLLPTRRAGRALRDAFLRRAGAQPVLLPRLRPLGDVDDDELAFAENEGSAVELKPAIPDLRRRLMLARAILALGQSGETQSPEQAVELAGELARLLDQMQTERLTFDKLETLVPDAYAQHWQRTLTFLAILTQRWPSVLAEEGLIDPAERRNLATEALARQWRATPPSERVIAAGSTGSIPATAELLDVVARLPQGAVILPGLDTGLDDESWTALDETHPQFGLKRLLEKLEVARGDVPAWHGVVAKDDRAPRARLLSLALRPAATTASWQLHTKIEPRALAGLSRLDCPHPQAEAATIALLMREALQDEERSAALITPDRDLARRVAAELKRFDVTVDDSAGRPLSETPPGIFLRLVAEMIAQDAAPAPLLACLKHPLAAGGLEPSVFRARVRQLERLVLRGPRPDAGLAGVLAALRARVGTEKESLAAWFAAIVSDADAFSAAMGSKAPPAELLRLQVALAERLAASDTQSGADRLWSQDSGEALANFVRELDEALAGLGAIAGPEYPGLFIAALGGRMVRPAFGGHPRLSILGLLEARLVQADLVILGGLNEGTWPPQPTADPWMSRPMRAMLGLPSPERRIGLTAHDFVQACGAPQVVLTRATRVEGTPTVASRWLLRLDTLLRAGGHPDGLTSQNRLHLQWARRLDEAGVPQPVTPPAPCPPVAARPRVLSVTDVEMWRRDPYALYARRILRLKALDPLDADAGAAERGLIIHAILAEFVRRFPRELPDNAREALIEIGRREFGATLANPGVWAFWWPRFCAVAAWFIDQERARRPQALPLMPEAKGSLEIGSGAQRFVLNARADRIDGLPDGGLVIIDYKTGAPPSAKEVALGFAPQLPLEAAIAAGGGFSDVGARPVAELSYWRLSGGEPPGAETRLDGATYNRKEKLPDAAGLAAQALEGLIALIARFDDVRTPYHARPRPRFARANDYAHLARVGEWASLEGGE